MREPDLTHGLFSSSHAQFLEQLSTQDFWQYAQELAHATPTGQKPAEEYLLCDVERGQCIVPLAALYEVVPPPHQLTLLPASPPWMPGVTAWRGTTIAVVDLDAYLAGEKAKPRTDGLLLVAHMDDVGDFTLGLLVSLVGATTTLDADHLVSPEHASAKYPLVSPMTIKGLYADALMIDMPVVLTDMVNHIKAAASYE